MKFGHLTVFFILSIALTGSSFLTGCIKKDGNTISIGLPSAESLFPSYDKSRQLVIPKNAQNISFMEGSWETVRGLGETVYHKNVILYFQFNKAGQGKLTVKMAGSTCTGNALAQLFGDAISIQTLSTTCTNGQTFNNSFATCEDEGLEGVVCRANNSANGSAFSYKLLRR